MGSRATTVTLGVFGGISLVIAMVGLYCYVQLYFRRKRKTDCDESKPNPRVGGKCKNGFKRNDSTIKIKRLSSNSLVEESSAEITIYKENRNNELNGIKNEIHGNFSNDQQDLQNMAGNLSDTLSSSIPDITKHIVHEKEMESNFKHGNSSDIKGLPNVRSGMSELKDDAERSDLIYGATNGDLPSVANDIEKELDFYQLLRSSIHEDPSTSDPYKDNLSSQPLDQSEILKKNSLVLQSYEKFSSEESCRRKRSRLSGVRDNSFSSCEDSPQGFYGGILQDDRSSPPPPPCPTGPLRGLV